MLILHLIYLNSGKEKENGNLTVKLSVGERVRTKESLDFEIEYLSQRETIEFSVKIEFLSSAQVYIYLV